jgi:hypothetical protein
MAGIIHPMKAHIIRLNRDLSLCMYGYFYAFNRTRTGFGISAGDQDRVFIDKNQVADQGHPHIQRCDQHTV